MIKKCDLAETPLCESKFQDKRYGKGRRVHNPRKSDNDKPRCTVCGREN